MASAAVPIPASRAQPEGVHAPSEVVDPSRYRWQDADAPQPPLTSLYELHVGTFSPAGTFDGVTERLAELQGLGFDVLELMPVGTWAGPRGWGYDGVAWLAPHAAYGGPERLRALVDACHQRGMAVVLDVVLQPPRPRGQLPRGVRALLHRSPHRLGRGPRPRRSSRGTGARLHLARRAGPGSGVPPRRAARRCRARARGSLAAAPRGGAQRGAACRWRAARAAGMGHRRERPRHPARGRVPRGGWLGLRRALARRFP